jgi:hypothetical protein
MKLRKIEHTLHSRSSIKEVEAEMTRCGVPLHAGGNYAVDNHFESYCFDSINTAEDAIKFADELDKDSTTGCAKARSIRDGINDGGFYSKNPRHCLASARRVCCGCHETGSYAKRNQ